MTYCIELDPYYESTTIKPLLQNSIIRAKQKKVNEEDPDFREYRTDRWFHGEKHAYVFIDITMQAKAHKRPFARKPSEVNDLIKSGKLIVVKYI